MHASDSLLRLSLKFSGNCLGIARKWTKWVHIALLHGNMWVVTVRLFVTGKLSRTAELT